MEVPEIIIHSVDYEEIAEAAPSEHSIHPVPEPIVDDPFEAFEPINLVQRRESFNFRAI